MARAGDQVVAVSGGEGDAYTLARYDLDIYPRMAETMENIVLLSQGGMELAPGTKNLTPIGVGTAQFELRPWVFSQLTSRCLAFSEELLFFLQSDGFISMPAAAATIGTFTNQSAAPPAGGDPAPDGGTGTVPPDVAPDDPGGSPEGSYFFDGTYWWVQGPDGPIFIGPVLA